MEPEPIDDPKLVMIVGVVGLVINVIGLFLFGGGHGHSHGSGGGDDDGTQEPCHDDSDSDDYSEVYMENGISARNINPIYGISVEDGKSTEEGFGTAVWVTNNDEFSGGGDETGSEPDAKKEKKEKKKRKASETDQMNIRGVFLHVLADALGSIVVIISAGVILATDPPSDPEVRSMKFC